jgi:hypothetical protein
VAAPEEANDDGALVAYVKACLERIGDYFAEPDVVEEALAEHRELWESLYRLDTSEDDD